MNKFLRYSLVALLAMFVGNAFAAGVYFDFDANYATLFPTLKGTSSDVSHDGDFTEATTSTAVDGFTVTVSAANEGASAANRIWHSDPRLRMYSGTLTIKGKGIKQIYFNDGGSLKLTPSTGTLTGSLWKGEADEVVFTVGGNSRIHGIEINGEDPNIPLFTSVTQYCENARNEYTSPYVILAFGDSKPRVTYANGKYVYVRDTEEQFVNNHMNGMCFYNQDAFAEATNKWQLGGRIQGTPTVYNELPQFKVTDASELTHTDVGEYQPVEFTEITFKKEENVANLVKFTEDLTVVKDGSKFYVLNHTLQVYDNFKLGYTLQDGDVIKGLTGVIIRYNETYEIAPTTTPVTTAINTIEADKVQNGVIYNLAGQKVDKSYKGLVIKNGKKVINK